jgi:hypothetical protein
MRTPTHITRRYIALRRAGIRVRLGGRTGYGIRWPRHEIKEQRRFQFMAVRWFKKYRPTRGEWEWELHGHKVRSYPKIHNSPPQKP